ncbi:MAG: pilus assembly protein TadG-related protein [Gemmataceae bacterium]|nr:pilus assembly protein TadG-related protein [Gemmataceae bacterium]MDW8243466.1 pilus assembly protein TadG-related protein [Thermogemmata sp.]
MLAPSLPYHYYRRRGAAGVSLLISLPVLLLLVGLALYIGLLRDVRQEAQTGADAAALAGARLLADDSLLLRQGYHKAMEERVRSARQVAQIIAQMNFAGDQQLRLDLNEANDPQGDIVVGQLDEPLRGTFTPLPTDPSLWENASINAVRVQVRRSPLPGLWGGRPPQQDIAARATAMLDWRVVGFRPRNEQPIPLMPIALYTDHNGADPSGWDGQWQHRHHDLWRYDPHHQQWQVGPDGLSEIHLVLGDTGLASSQALFVQIGVEDFAGTINQIQQGIRRGELERQFGAGGFVLRGDNKVDVPGMAGLPPAGSPGRHRLLEALQQVAGGGEPRLWPLFTYYDAAQGQVTISGWTAARLVQVQTSNTVTLVLQPCVLVHPAVVTEGRDPPPPFWKNNRMVCRVRLAE